jgi:hypothetical protein
MNGNVEEDYIYEELLKSSLKGTLTALYKHLCGEYETSGSFAMLLAALILKTQQIPSIVPLTGSLAGNIKHVLVYHHRHNLNHSFTLLSKC